MFKNYPFQCVINVNIIETSFGSQLGNPMCILHYQRISTARGYWTGICHTERTRQPIMLSHAFFLSFPTFDYDQKTTVAVSINSNHPHLLGPVGTVSVCKLPLKLGKRPSFARPIRFNLPSCGIFMTPTRREQYLRIS